ncbi:MAG: hypothetical protein IEMM0001_0851 [bacterium]|nr:MAG: hypothetical protein IEMM0001_0851 [bacterium]
MRILDSLVTSVREAAVFNPDVQLAPACILWPDRDRQWEAVIPRLQNEMPELLVLGDYEPERKTGPAIWLRCVIAGLNNPQVTQKDADIKSMEESLRKSAPSAENITPIIYLPGVSRHDLRAVESCPAYLKPLAELQYLGVIWSQVNAKDWTILAFLKSDQGGLGLDVAMDKATLSAMQLSIYRLLDEEVELLRGKRLDKDYFNTLLTGGDPVRDLLQWLDQGDAFRSARGENEWRAFVEVCKSQLAFHPENDGILAGADRLASHEGPWKPVWERFCEAPRRYPNIPAQIRRCQPPMDTIFWLTSDGGYDGWPQWNEDMENSLRQSLSSLGEHPPHEARKRIADMVKQHGRRKKLVWAELGEAPLACAVEHLGTLAEITSNALSAGTVEDLATTYSNSGWKADDAVLRSLACINRQEDQEAVTTAIRSIYLPWAEESARHLQNIVDKSGYPFKKVQAASIRLNKKSQDGSSTIILFVDGLRFDIARRLEALLDEAGLHVDGKINWAALPSVTATGKPAVTPLAHLISGELTNADFEPSVADTGQSLKGGYHLKRLLIDNGWSVLGKSEAGDGNGRAWSEFGDIDHEGHDRGWKLAKHLDGMLAEIMDRVETLISAGWKAVRIVTDHGWLLMPGGLPKIDLPGALTENKWGRCAAIKPGADTDERLFPWYWNCNQYFALANGISCYRKGEEYAHGGISLQECLTLELTVFAGDGGRTSLSSIEIKDIVWKGLRCKVSVDGGVASLFLDVRKEAGNSAASVAMSVNPIKDNGVGSVVVEDEELEGTDAAIVLLDADGALVTQVMTVIGGGNR